MSNGDGSSNSLVSRSRTEGSYGEMVEYFQVIFFNANLTFHGFFINK